MFKNSTLRSVAWVSLFLFVLLACFFPRQDKPEQREPQRHEARFNSQSNSSLPSAQNIGNTQTELAEQAKAIEMDEVASSPPGHKPSNSVPPAGEPEFQVTSSEEARTPNTEPLVSQNNQNPPPLRLRSPGEAFDSLNPLHPLHGRELLDYTHRRISATEEREDLFVRNIENDQVETVAVERTWTWNSIQEEWQAGDVLMDAERILLGEVDEAFIVSIQAELDQLGITLERKLPLSPVYIFKIRESAPGRVQELVSAIEALLPQNGQAFVEPEHLAYPAAIPNDPLWDSQLWHMEKIQAHLAWDITEGDPRVVVAVADTGTRITHEDIRNILWTNPGEVAGNGIDDDGNGFVDDLHGWNVNDNNNDLTDVNGHGTHVGGTMGAEGNNGKGVVGVGWKHKLMVFAVGGTLGSSETADGLDYMTMMKTRHGVNVVSSNWSFGSLYTNSSYSGSSTRRNAIERARDVGILFVAAAGNDGKELEGKVDHDGDGTFYNHFPSSQTVKDYPSTGDWESVVSVAASTSNDGKAGFSNYGHGGPEAQVVDLAAPGAGIHSTTRSNDGSYGDKQGTSMASPHVAGAIGLVASANPSLPTRKVLDIVYNTLDPANTWLTRSEYQGRLNVFTAVQEANSYPHSQIANLADDMVFPSGSSIEVVVDAWDTDGSVSEVRLYEGGNPTPIGVDTDGSDGWTFTWSPADGIYDLHVAATDNDGKIADPAEDQDVANLRIHNLQIGSWSVLVEAGEGGASDGFFATTSSSYQAKFGESVMYNYSHVSGEYYRFGFQVPVSGTWDLGMWWPLYNNGAQTVPVRIQHEGGPTELTVNQSQDGGQFNSLGSFNFNSGQTYTLEIYHDGNDLNYVFADALLLTRDFSPSNPQVYVTAKEPEIAEDGAGTQFLFTRSDATGALTVNLNVSGTATAGLDYTALPGTISFADGESTVELPLSPLDDDEVEDTELIELSIVSGSGYDPAPSGNSASISLTSEDLAGEFNFTVTSRSVSEGVGTFDLSITRSHGSSGAVSVDVDSSNNGASAGSDYQSFSQTLNWADGDNSSQDITLTVIDDSLYNEGNEKFRVTLSNPSNGSILGDKKQVTVTITENDINAAPVITLNSPASTQLGLPSTSVGLILDTTVTDDGIQSPLTYTWSQISGSGNASFSTTDSEDTEVLFDSVGSYQLQLTADDGALQSSLTLSVTVGGSGPLGYQESGGLVVMEAEDFDSSVSADGKSWTLQSDVSDYAGTGHVTVLPNSGQNTNTGYTAGGSPRLDYLVNFSSTGTYIIWFRGSSTSGNDDSVHAGLNDQVIATADRINLGSGGDGSWVWKRSTMDNANASLDVDSAGEHSFNLYMREDGAAVDRILLTTDSNYTPSGSGPDTSLRGVRQAADVDPGGPYSISVNSSLLLNASVSDDGFPETPGATSVSWSQISGPGTASFVDASVEDASVSFDSEGSYQLRLTATDGDSYTFADVEVTVTPAGPGVLIAESNGSTEVSEEGSTDSYSLVLAMQPTQDVTINVSADTEVQVDQTSLTFTPANWDSPQTVTVSAVDDSDTENAHSGSISHNVSSSDGDYDGITVPDISVAITDNDLPGTLVLASSTYSIHEGNGQVILSVTRNAGSAGAVSVDVDSSDLSATAGTDYSSFSTTLTWEDGDSAAKSIIIPITEDSSYEGEEQFTVSLSNVTSATLGSPAAATVTLIDNDLPSADLVLHYPFEEGSGTSTADQAGTNTGTLKNSIQWTSGQLGGALDFDLSGGSGVFEDVTTANSVNIPADSSWSASAWVRLESTPASGNNRLILQQNDGGGGTGRSWLAVSDSMKLYSYLGGNSTESTTALTLNQWHHVAITAGSGTITLYLDGVAVGNSSLDVEANQGIFHIGNHKSPTDEKQWDGQIDDVRIYSRILSASELSDIALFVPPAAPSAPDTLTATTISSSIIALNWNDSSANEHSFIIQRANSSSGPWTTIGSTAANVSSYEDGALQAGDTWYYRVLAVNAGGSSLPSNTASDQLWTEEEAYYEDTGLSHDVDPGLDSDGDGISNEDEFTAGTNPNDDEDVLAVDLMDQAGNMNLQTETIAGKYYRIMWRSSLTSGSWTPLTGYEGQTASDGSSLSVALSAEGFYRVEVSTTAW